MQPSNTQPLIDSIRKKVGVFRTSDGALNHMIRRDLLDKRAVCIQTNNEVREIENDLDLLEAAIAKEGGGDG